jgi:hypothetical protein
VSSYQISVHFATRFQGRRYFFRNQPISNKNCLWWPCSLRDRDKIGLSWPWSYCSLNYNYLCNQCLSPLMLWVQISIKARCTTLCDKICQWLATGRWFSPSSPIFTTNKADSHDITEILLKAGLNTIKETKWTIAISSFGQAVAEEKVFRNRPIRNENCMWQQCLLMNRAEMDILHRGPSIYVSYHVLVDLAKRFQRRRFVYNSTNQKQEWPVVAMFVNGSGRKEHSL